MKTFEEFEHTTNDHDKIINFLESYFNYYELKKAFNTDVNVTIWFNGVEEYYQISFDVKQLKNSKFDENDISDLKTLYNDKIKIFDNAIKYLKKFDKNEKDISSSLGQFNIVFINFSLNSQEILKHITSIPNDIKSLLIINKFNL